MFSGEPDLLMDDDCKPEAADRRLLSPRLGTMFLKLGPRGCLIANVGRAAC